MPGGAKSLKTVVHTVWGLGLVYCEWIGHLHMREIIIIGRKQSTTLSHIYAGHGNHAKAHVRVMPYTHTTTPRLSGHQVKLITVLGLALDPRMLTYREY